MTTPPEMVLVVGGSFDGRRVPMPESRRLAVPIPAAPLASLFTVTEESFLGGPECKTEIYEAMQFMGKDKRFFVMALTGLTADDVMKTLLDGYKEAQ